MSNPADEVRVVRLLEIEFDYLQRWIDKYEGARFLIKGWAVTASGALLALSVTANRASLAFIGLGAVVVFAYIEVLLVYLQDHVIARSNMVERLLDSSARGQTPVNVEEYRFGISAAFKGRYQLRGLVRALSGRPHIYVLHLALAGGLLAVALLLVTT